MKIIENRRKNKGPSPWENQRNQCLGKQRPGRGERSTKKTNARNTWREQSKTPKRHDDALGDIGGCCFMYKKMKFSTLAAQRLLPKRCLALQNTCKKQESMPRGKQGNSMNTKESYPFEDHCKPKKRKSPANGESRTSKETQRTPTIGRPQTL